MKNHRKKYSTAQRIAFNFGIVILIGTFLLKMPFSLQKGQSISLLDAMFVAVSATCVTGLTPIVVATTFNWFGKLVLLCLMQIGGLGLMTIMASFVLFLRNRITLAERQTLSEMLNRSDLFNFNIFVKKVVKFTLCFELIGAILLLPVFLKDHAVLQAFAHAIFTAVSAFCNAGFDLLGANSLSIFHKNYYFQIVVMILIVSGGLGFAVWSDLHDCYKKFRQSKSLHYAFKKISTHSKVVLTITLFLIVIPALMIYTLEFQYFKNLSFLEALFGSLFQSITLRTAGFYTIPFSQFRFVTLIFMIPLMFIGGSSGGTAGGVKTTTIFIAVSYLISMIKGKKDVVVFNRTIDKEVTIRAFTLILINVIVLFIGIFFISLEIKDVEVIPYAFEATSALATVGISTGITASISAFGKIVLIALMYIGRIGIVTLVFSMRGTQSKSSASVGYPTGNVIVG